MGIKLPPEYQEAEYLESTGTQYIDTGYFPNNNTKAECGFLAPTVNNVAVFGSRDGNNIAAKDFDVIAYDQNSYGLIVRFNSQNQSKKPCLSNVFHTVSIESGNLVFDGNVFSTHKPSAFQAKVNTLTLFARHLNSSHQVVYGSVRIYHFRLFDGGNPVFDLVPCYRKLDSKPGMYDLVTNTLFTNAGTGEFTVGPDVIDSISPWLVARRRLLMRKPLVDTSPKISTYGKRLYGVSGTTNSASCCITEFYDVETIPTVQGRIVLGTPAVGAQSNFQCWNDSGAINYAEKAYPYLYVGTTRIRFTLLIDNIDDSYAYNPDDGQIWFAGKNTIYYGYTNINDMPTGT